jgi:hypothetical protein
MNIFQILTGLGSGLAIQAPEMVGNPITLQTPMFGNLFQMWQVQIQIANGFTGMAIFNPLTQSSITTNGKFGKANPLVTLPFSSGSTNLDSWYIVQGTKDGLFRLAFPPDVTWTFNDIDGQGLVGDKLCLFNDSLPNSTWRVNPLF